MPPQGILIAHPHAIDFARVERAPPPAAFDLGLDFARMGRTLLTWPGKDAVSSRVAKRPKKLIRLQRLGEPLLPREVIPNPAKKGFVIPNPAKKRFYHSEPCQKKACHSEPSQKSFVIPNRAEGPVRNLLSPPPS